MFRHSRMIKFILGFFFFGYVTCMQMCPQEDLDQCLRLADPFIQDEKFVFPVNINEIQSMCMAWDTLTACVKNFVIRCLSSDRQQEFDIAVQESEDTMQQMCQDRTYQAEYLQNANCIKSVSVKQQRCGEKYIKLVSEVATKLNYESLCCHFGKYRNCVLSLTAVDCSSAASNFARHLLDKSMGVLLRKCRNGTQSELIDDCPQGSASRDNNNNNIDNSPNILDSSSRNQAGVGQQQPAFLAPTITPQPTARWTYDPQNIGGIEPESWLDNNKCENNTPLKMSILVAIASISYYLFCS